MCLLSLLPLKLMSLHECSVPFSFIETLYFDIIFAISCEQTEVVSAPLPASLCTINEVHYQKEVQLDFCELLM